MTLTTARMKQGINLANTYTKQHSDSIPRLSISRPLPNKYIPVKGVNNRTEKPAMQREKPATIKAKVSAPNTTTGIKITKNMSKIATNINAIGTISRGESNARKGSAKISRITPAQTGIPLDFVLEGEED